MRRQVQTGAGIVRCSAAPVAQEIVLLAEYAPDGVITIGGVQYPARPWRSPTEIDYAIVELPRDVLAACMGRCVKGSARTRMERAEARDPLHRANHRYFDRAGTR